MRRPSAILPWVRISTVSQLFEALRRGRQSPHSSPGSSRRTAHTDAVLATLGYASERRGAGPRRVLARVLAMIAITAGAWFGWQWYSSLSVKPAARAQVNRPPQPASPSAPRIVRTPETGVPPRALPPALPTAPTSTTSAPPVLRTVRPGVAIPPSKTLGAPSVPTGTAPPQLGARPVAPPPPAPVSRPETAVPTPSSASPAASVDHFQRGVYYQRAGDFENALLHYRELLKQNEFNAQAHNNLGLLYQQKGLLDDAVKEFDRALFIEGSYVTARNNLGVALLEQGKVDAAAAHFRSVLETQPRNLDAMINLALAEKAAGRLERGKESLLRALGIDPRSAVAHYNLATLYDQTGDVSRAVEHYRAFLDNAGAEHAARAPGVRARVDALTKPRQS